MNIDEYLVLPDYLLFLDETLRQQACLTVDSYLGAHEKHAKKTQLYSITAVIKAGGLGTLKDLVEKQKSKNTNTENKIFWEFIFSLFDKGITSPPEFSLRAIVAKDLQKWGVVTDESGASEKAEQKRIKKANDRIIETIIDAVLPIYFEHFTCHYFYRTN
jgi:hypothetical protein